MFKKKLWLLGIVCGGMILSGLTGCMTATRTTTTATTSTKISGTTSLTPNTNTDVSKITSTSITIFTTTSSTPATAVTTLAISSQYTPSEAITALLRESEVSFGKHIPIPAYLPQGYEISYVQVYQQSESEQKEADLIITKLNAPNITLSLVWDAGGTFRILSTSEQYMFVNMSGGLGTPTMLIFFILIIEQYYHYLES